MGYTDGFYTYDSEEQRQRELESISSFLEQQHQNGEICYVLGVEMMARLIHASCVRDNGGQSYATLEELRDAVAAGYCDHTVDGNAPSLIPGAIAFSAGPNSRQVTYLSPSGRRWHIPDVAVRDLSRIVKLEPFVPNADEVGRPTNRTWRNRLEKTLLFPFWVAARHAFLILDSSGNIGVPVGHKETPELWNGEHPCQHPDGSLITSTKVIFTWPGYAHVKPFSRQIHLDQGPVKDRGNYQGFITQMKRQIRNCITYYEKEQCTDPRWRVGPGYITAEDLIIDAILPTSQGVHMPSLRVRDTYVFPTEVVSLLVHHAEAQDGLSFSVPRPPPHGGSAPGGVQYYTNAGHDSDGPVPQNDDYDHGLGAHDPDPVYNAELHAASSSSGVFVDNSARGGVGRDFNTGYDSGIVGFDLDGWLAQNDVYDHGLGAHDPDRVHNAEPQAASSFPGVSVNGSAPGGVEHHTNTGFDWDIGLGNPEATASEVNLTAWLSFYEAYDRGAYAPLGR